MMALLFLSILILPIATEGMFWTKRYPEDFIDELTSPKNRWFKADGWANVSFVVLVLQIYHIDVEISLTLIIYPLPKYTYTKGPTICKWME